jgi:predicted HAD superfamily Cof-like phosphohydrolase
MNDIEAGFHRAVAAGISLRQRNGKDVAYDDAVGLDAILREAFEYAAHGSTTQAGVSIMAARSYLQRHTKNPMQQAIEDFMGRCDQEIAKYPQLPDVKVRNLRIRLMVEELLGSKTPYADILRMEGTDLDTQLLLNKSNELVQSMLDGDLVGIADGIADMLYVVIGTAAAYGIDIQEVFDEVHRSNLSKSVWSEAEGRYLVEKDEFGKLIKADTYSPADIKPIIDRQIQNGKEWEEFYADQAHDSEMVLGSLDS